SEKAFALILLPDHGIIHGHSLKKIHAAVFPLAPRRQILPEHLLKIISKTHGLVLEAAPGESINGEHVGSVKMRSAGRRKRPMDDALRSCSLIKLANFQTF